MHEHCRQLTSEEPFLSALPADWWQNANLGYVIATCELQDCTLIDKHYQVSEPEKSFGDFTPGRYAWRLGNTKLLPRPKSAKGSLGLWEWVVNTTQGRRLPDNTSSWHWPPFEPGDYILNLPTGTWYGCPPAGDPDLLANLGAHTVIEHDDGTITVSPSILVRQGSLSWHGYLEHGVWRDD